MLLRKLEPAEIAVWWLLASIMSLQTLADLGFAPTFTRLIAYAMGGANPVGEARGHEDQYRRRDGPNWAVVEAVWSTMQVTYARLTVLALLPIACFGTWALVRPMSALDNPDKGWVAWVIVLTVSAAVFRANAFSAYLEGVNQVALLRRWQVLTSVGVIITLFVVLLSGGRLLSLVIASQSWAILNAARNWQLARHVNDGRLSSFKTGEVDRAMFRVAWPAAWRSGVGSLFSQGVFYASGLVYAQVADAAALSTYLLAFRWIQLISELCQAPFYSKIPVLSRLRAEGRAEDQLKLAQHGMRLALWTYVSGFVTVGILGSTVLHAIGSRVEFASSALWVLLGLGFFIERYGAMHIQLYSTTNHIIWHVANGVTGTVYLIVSIGLLKFIGVFAFPVAVIVGYLSFYSWYAAMHDYRLFNSNFWQFERTVALPAAVVVVLYAVTALVL